MRAQLQEQVTRRQKSTERLFVRSANAPATATDETQPERHRRFLVASPPNEDAVFVIGAQRCCDAFADGVARPQSSPGVELTALRVGSEDFRNLSSETWSGARDLNPGPHGPESDHIPSSRAASWVFSTNLHSNATRASKSEAFCAPDYYTDCYRTSTEHTQIALRLPASRMASADGRFVATSSFRQSAHARAIERVALCP